MRAILSVCLLILLCLPAPAPAGEDSLISFEIKDQFDDPHTDGDYRGQAILLIGNDKGSKEYKGLWREAIGELLTENNLTDQIEFVPVADLRGVPFFLKGKIKGNFPKDPEMAVLMDWKGKFAKAYELEKGMSNILFFDRQGTLVFQITGTEVDKGKLDLLLGSISRNLEPR